MYWGSRQIDMKKGILYIHGKGGSAEEAEHYKSLFPDCDVIGFDYAAQFPWEAKEAFPAFLREISGRYASVEIIANSIGALFAMYGFSGEKIGKAYLISPVVDMEKLIIDMMSWESVTEDVLKEKGEIKTAYGETLSWEYLCYVRENPVSWQIPTHILYGQRDHLTSYETISKFAEQTGASLTVMESGEHWFHTEEQMQFLDRWILEHS